MLALLDALQTIPASTGRPSRAVSIPTNRVGGSSRGSGTGRTRRTVTACSTSATRRVRRSDRSSRAHPPKRPAARASTSANGSLMRILPIAPVFHDKDDHELATLAHRASRVTHGTTHAQVACALYVLIAKRLLAASIRPRRSTTPVPACAPSTRRTLSGSPHSITSRDTASAPVAVASGTASGAHGTRSRAGRLPGDHRARRSPTATTRTRPRRSRAASPGSTGA